MTWIREELESIERANRLRSPLHSSGSPGPVVEVDGRRLIHLCSNNYLGLASDERVVAAAADALRHFGAGTGGSRLVSGGTTLHQDLERECAALKGAEAALVFSSGYLANTGSIPVLAGPGDAIFSDALNHASIIDGCRLSGATVHVYRHADADHATSLIARTAARRKLIVTDGLFSMDGDLAPLEALVAACDRHGAMLMVDEAHATGVLGANGGGTLEHFGLTGRATVAMGTLSKALGSSGGFIAGSSDLIALLRNRARSFVFDTALSAPAAAAALASLRIARAEPRRRERALALAGKLAAGIAECGYDVRTPHGAVVPVVLGTEERALDVSRRLLDAGVLAQAIRPPTVPDGTSRIRCTTMATHTDDQIGEAIEAFRKAAG